MISLHIEAYQPAYHDIACNTALRCCRLEGVPPLESYQHKRRELKRKKVAGVHLNDFLDLQRWAEAHRLPARREDMVPFKIYAVPMEWTDFLTVEAVVLTFSRGKPAQVALSSLIFLVVILLTRASVRSSDQLSSSEAIMDAI